MTFGWEAVLLVLLVGWTAGYAVGRRNGRSGGFEEGLRYAPLHLKQAAWLDGRCPVCGAVDSGMEPGDTGETDSGGGDDGTHRLFHFEKGY